MAVLDYDDIAHLPGFRKRMDWFLENRKDLCEQTSYMEQDDSDGHTHRLLAIPSLGRLLRVLKYLLDENEFLSPYGIRSLSKFHQQHPYTLETDGVEQRVDYEPADSTSGTFGGNSNWRGPIWFPINYLIVEALERYHHFYGDHLRVECPTGSGRMMNLKDVAGEIMSRLARIFLRRPRWPRGVAMLRALRATIRTGVNSTLFYEFFHADNGTRPGRKPSDRVDLTGGAMAGRYSPAEWRVRERSQETGVRRQKSGARRQKPSSIASAEARRSAWPSGSARTRACLLTSDFCLLTPDS